MLKTTTTSANAWEAIQAQGKKSYIIKHGILLFGSINALLFYIGHAVFENVRNEMPLLDSYGFMTYTMTELILGGLSLMIIAGGINGWLSWNMFRWMNKSNGSEPKSHQ